MISIPMYARVTEPIGKWYINGKSLSDLYVPGMSVQNDCHLAGFPLFVGSKVETTTLHTEHFGEFGVRSQRKSCDIPDWDFSLQDLASAIPYFQPL
jgi:hypothetical protein